MRIISGTLKGIQLMAPRDLPVRPTTDKAKEALFNILGNRVELDASSCLDLFAGTGSISFELASRQAVSIVAVDENRKCCRFIEQFAAKHQLEQLEVVLSDVFRFLENDHMQYDLIFADPPYDLSNRLRLTNLVFERSLLKEDGLMILEHSSYVTVATHPHFREKRVYGSSAFSFFSN